MLAVFTYPALKKVLPPALVGTARGPLPLVAIVVGIFVACAVLVAALRILESRRILDQQTSLESIRELTWQQFELLLGEYWRRRGFDVEETGGGGPDGGIDLILKREGQVFVVQCKQWKTWQVGVKPVRELFGVMTAQRASGAYLVTSGSYTTDAMTFAEGKPLELIDGDHLIRMIKEVQAAKRVEPTMGSSQVSETPACPSCGSQMVKRTARRGVGAGQVFWGCPMFPKCRGTRAA